MVVFKTWDIRQKGTMIPKRWETNEMSPETALSYCFQSVPILCKVGESRQSLLN